MTTREQRKAYQKAYNATHHAEIAKRNAIYKNQHRAEIEATRVMYRISHKAEIAKCNASYAIQHREELRIYAADRRAKERTEVFGHYGNHCTCCGEDNPKFLAIDHINGGGNKHRKEIGGKLGGVFYHWLIKNKFPEGFQTLCHNCNFAKGHYHICPHNNKSITWDATGFHLALAPLQQGATI